MTGHQIIASAVGKDYGAVSALNDIDIDVEPGEFLVLLGPSGSGKSTLIRTLAGVDRIDRGVLSVGDRVVDDTTRHIPPDKRDLAMVFQDYALWPHLTVAKNVAFALRRRKLAPSISHARTMETLEIVGLADHAARYPGELSGGEQQRVALARAVVARPGLLLFDEPLSNLDADLRERLRVEISTLTRMCGATAVYITHDQSEAFALADRIGVLDHGRLAQLAKPETVYAEPASPFVARFTGSSGDLSGWVTHVDGEHVQVAVGRTRLRTRHIGPLAVGTAVSVLVRPAAAELAPPDADGALPAMVADVAYRGRGYDHVVHTDIGILSSVHAPSRSNRGERVGVVLDPDGCHAFANPTPSDTRDKINLTTVRPHALSVPSGTLTDGGRLIP